MKKRRWSYSGSLPILHIDESEGKVDIYLNKQFTYPSLFFLCLHNSIFSPLFFAFPPKILIFSQQNQHHQISIVLPPLPPSSSSSSYPSYSSYFSSSCYPSSSSLLRLASIVSSPSRFFWRSVIGGCPQAREGPATEVNQLERSRRIALLEDM